MLNKLVALSLALACRLDDTIRWHQGGKLGPRRRKKKNIIYCHVLYFPVLHNCLILKE